MNLRLFWNELSEKPPASDRRQALQRMNIFVDTCAALLRIHRAAPPRLRSYQPLDAITLCGEYTVAHWQRETDRDRRTIFLRLAASAPLLREPEDEQESSDRFGCSDCFHDGESALGLRAAWAADEIAISLDSDVKWNRPQILVEVACLDAEQSLIQTTEVVRHLLLPEHVEAHRLWLRDLQVRLVRDGKDLWDRRRALFPTLDFCTGVQRQLCALDSGSEALRSVARRLFELERAFLEWDGRPLHNAFVPIKCTPETQQTLTEEAADHTATRPDGRAQLFSWHIRYTPGQGRIFFHGDADLRRGLIGYIGIKKDGRLT